MPTGYTKLIYDDNHNVRDDITLAEFAWRCARGVGALLHQRDASLSAPVDLNVTDRFGTEKFARERLQELTAKERELLDKSETDVVRQMKAEFDEDHKWWVQQSLRYARNNACINALIDEVKAWDVSSTHDKFKEFMVDTLGPPPVPRKSR